MVSKGGGFSHLTNQLLHVLTNVVVRVEHYVHLDNHHYFYLKRCKLKAGEKKNKEKLGLKYIIPG